MTKWYFFNGRSCLGSGGGLAAPGAGQERSHAAWRSFFLKTMLPMQHGARSGPQGYPQEGSHAHTQTRSQHVLKYFRTCWAHSQHVLNCFRTCWATNRQTFEKHTNTNIRSNKRSIKQTTNKEPSIQPNEQQRKKTKKNPNKKPYIKNYATPDRPPPAAAMLQMQYS